MGSEFSEYCVKMNELPDVMSQTFGKHDCVLDNIK